MAFGEEGEGGGCAKLVEDELEDFVYVMGECELAGHGACQLYALRTAETIHVRGNWAVVVVRGGGVGVGWGGVG